VANRIFSSGVSLMPKVSESDFTGSHQPTPTHNSHSISKTRISKGYSGWISFSFDLFVHLKKKLTFLSIFLGNELAIDFDLKIRLH